jgi:hypothetical protein
MQEERGIEEESRSSRERKGNRARERKATGKVW